MMPKLRFRGFEQFGSHYSRLRFDEVFNFSTGKNIKQNEASSKFRTPCVRYGELYHLYSEVIQKVANKTNLSAKDLFFSKGDEILIPSAGEDPMDIGSASALTVRNVAIGRTINVLRPKKRDVYSQIFASYYINSVLRKKISTLARGSSISNVYNSDLRKLYINLPSLPEQEKIAGFLGIVDDKISGLEKKKELLEKYKKGVMQKIFPSADGQAPQIRFKGFSGKWEEKKLSEVAEIIGGGTPDTSNSKYWGGGIYWLTPTEVKNKYVNSSLRTITELGLKNSSAKLLSVGTIIFTSRATVGEVAIAQVPIVTNQGFQSIIVNEENDNTFIYYWTKMNKKEFLRKSNGSTFLEISSKEMKRIKLLLPNFEEQKKIADFLTALDDKIELQNKKLHQAKLFKKSLLQKMFV